MLRPTTTTEIPPPSAPKDIIPPQKPRSSSPRTRRTPSFLFDSPPSAPLAPTTSNATATSTSKPTKSKNNKDNILSSPQSPRRSFFPSPSKSSFSSANSGGGNSSGFAGGIFSLSSLLARMPSAASIVPVLSSSHHHHHTDLPTNSNNTTSTSTSTSTSKTTQNNSSKKMAGGSKDKPSEPPRMTAAEKQEAVRNAQAILASVRRDWEWAEELKKSRRRRMAGATAASPTTSTSLPSIQSEEEEDTEDEDDREYRSRDESDSDDGRQPGSMKAVRSVYPDDEPRSAYRFHDPTAIGGSKITKEERKARRKKDLEEEMKWNDGLRIWIERRDLWTQADKNGRVPIGKSKFEDVSPTTANINPLDLDAIRFQDGLSYRAKWKNELLTLTPHYNYASYQNPFYDAVVPDAYPQLYQRIIIKNNTPTIPINLQHMTNALIEGWKADGQWPPKPSRPEASITKKKTVSVGESMVKRVFGIGR
ncbi:hypothetical protein TWF481_006669 [Arthrobotrys musiformis]|uniref:Gag1-like clamp domain-containing protein n=1 Tax=Arthrobotrys musiformis TaxID=47236 RepID=A0AAV9WAN5_9PEZI